MKKFTKKFAIFALFLFCVQSFMFSEEMTLLELSKEVLTLKYELYQIDNKLGDYKEMSDFKLYFEKAKKERKLNKYQKELDKKSEDNKEEAKKALEQAKKDLSKTGKNLQDLGKDIGEAFTDFFNK